MDEARDTGQVSALGGPPSQNRIYIESNFGADDATHGEGPA
jgi:hypothetical protein